MKSRRAWSADNPGNVLAREELRQAVIDAARDRVASGGLLLDVGCGTGWCLAALVEAGAEPGSVRGLDLDPARVEAARARVPGVRVEVGDACRLEQADGSVGAVFMILLLSSLGPDELIGAALREARRVLAPSGVLVVYEPRLPNPLNRATRLITNAHLDAAGLTPREQHTLTLVPQVGRRLGPLTGRLHPALSRIPPLRSHRLIVYRRPDAPSGGSGPASAA